MPSAHKPHRERESRFDGDRQPVTAGGAGRARRGGGVGDALTQRAVARDETTNIPLLPQRERGRLGVRLLVALHDAVLALQLGELRLHALCGPEKRKEV